MILELNFGCAMSAVDTCSAGGVVHNVIKCDEYYANTPVCYAVQCWPDAHNVAMQQPQNNMYTLKEQLCIRSLYCI